MKLSEVRGRKAISAENLAAALKAATHKFRLHMLELGAGIAPGPFHKVSQGQGSGFFKDELPFMVASTPESDEHQANLAASMTEAHGNLKMKLSYTADEGMAGLNDIIGKLREFGAKQGVVPRIDRSTPGRVSVSIEFHIGGIAG